MNSMWKCALISKIEKWHPHLEKLLQMSCDISESVSMTEKIGEDNERVNYKVSL